MKYKFFFLFSSLRLNYDSLWILVPLYVRKIKIFILFSSLRLNYGALPLKPAFHSQMLLAKHGSTLGV